MTLPQTPPPTSPSARADARPSELDTWLADEARLQAAMARGPGPGVIPREMAMTTDGLTVLQRLVAGELPYAAIAKTLDFLLVEVAPGRAVFQGSPGPAHLNPVGGIHGGWYATLLDSALGCAVHTTMPAGRGYTTAELGLHLVRAIPPKVSRVRAIGTVVHSGRQLATAEARLVGPDGTLYAHGSTTCLVFELPPAKA